MNTTILGVALILIVCLADVVCMFLVARRTWKQETTTRESLPEMYLLAFASATECIEECRRSGERLRSRKG